jgi:hypothetical protein
MQRGDAMLEVNSHVLLFDKWVDSTKDLFWEYAEHGTGKVASYDQISYNYLVSKGYFPCKYKYVV